MPQPHPPPGPARAVPLWVMTFLDLCSPLYECHPILDTSLTSSRVQSTPVAPATTPGLGSKRWVPGAKVRLDNSPLSLGLLICKMGAKECVPPTPTLLHKAKAQLRESLLRHSLGASWHTGGAWGPLVRVVKVKKPMKQWISNMSSVVSDSLRLHRL